MKFGEIVSSSDSFVGVSSFDASFFETSANDGVQPWVHPLDVCDVCIDQIA